MQVGWVKIGDFRQITGDAENARHEIAGHENARNAIVWNTACCICLSIAEQECMSRQERAPDFAVFRCLLALPLLPVTDIDPAFQDVKVLVHDVTIRRQRHCCCNCVATSSVSGSTSHPLVRHECPSAAIPRALTTLLKVFTRLCDDMRR